MVNKFENTRFDRIHESYPDGRTDRQTDGQTDRQTANGIGIGRAYAQHRVAKSHNKRKNE